MIINKTISKTFALLLAAIMLLAALSGCGNTAAPADSSSGESVSESASESESVPESESTPESETPAAALADGVYSATFTTDSSMFHVNEANNGKGVLTVAGGVMTIHVSLASQGIVNLFVGTAEDAQKDGAVLLEPTVDTVTYSDGTTEEVYGYDIPIAVINEDFDLAILGSKGKWYDHVVCVSDPVVEE